jgi:hypothetical protein
LALPIGFSLDLLDSTVVQDEYPDPPTMRVSRPYTIAHRGALSHGRLIADFISVLAYIRELSRQPAVFSVFAARRTDENNHRL